MSNLGEKFKESAEKFKNYIQGNKTTVRMFCGVSTAFLFGAALDHTLMWASMLAPTSLTLPSATISVALGFGAARQIDKGLKLLPNDDNNSILGSPKAGFIDAAGFAVLSGMATHMGFALSLCEFPKASVFGLLVGGICGATAVALFRDSAHALRSKVSRAMH